MTVAKANQIILGEDAMKRLAQAYQYILSDQWGNKKETADPSHLGRGKGSAGATTPEKDAEDD